MRNQRGFTLIELMLVVLIIGLITAIALPLYGNAMRNAERKALAVDCREIQSAFSRYQIDNGVYPADADFDLATMDPLVSDGYFTSLGPFLQKIEGNAVTLYTAPDVNGTDRQFIMIIKTISDDPEIVIITDTDQIGSYGWLGGVYVVVDGVVTPVGEAW